jgi:tetratricopeptide (TPR) repeat protein
MALNKQPFGGDESGFASNSIDLYQTALRSPALWRAAMLEAVPSRGPGIAWIGQFFVPLGYVMGSVDAAFLLLVYIALFIGLWLLYAALLEMSGRVGIAAVATVAIASGQLFMNSSQIFMIEPLQFLVAAWFIYLLSRAPKWNRSFLFGQLWIAVSFSLIVRATSPLYTGVLLVASALSAVWVRQENLVQWSARAVLASWVSGSVLAGMAFIWYSQNLPLVIAHSRGAAMGPIAAVWGKTDTFINTFLYWLNAIQRDLMHPAVLTVTLAACAAGLGIRWRVSASSAAGSARSYFSWCTVASIVQILVTLFLFSLGSSRVDRFLFPLWPCFAVVIAWCLSRVNNRVVTFVVLIAFAGQWIAVRAYAFGLMRENLSFAWVWRVNRDPRNGDILKEIIARACMERQASRYVSIVAIDPYLMGDWLAPEPAGYEAAKQYGIDSPCQMGYAGNGFFGASVADTWYDFSARQARYVVTTDPSVYPPPPNALNQALTSSTHPILLKMLRSSEAFVQEPPLRSASGILVFKKNTYLQDGRALIDAGQAETAIPILQKAAQAGPGNAEAWANLTYACFLTNRDDEALAAAERALALSPQHYWVNKMVASVYQRRGAYAQGLVFIQRALSSAPDDEERIRSLAIENELRRAASTAARPGH